MNLQKIFYRKFSQKSFRPFLSSVVSSSTVAATTIRPVVVCLVWSISVLALSFVVGISFVSCRSKNYNYAERGKYTYNTTAANIQTLSPTDWTLGDEGGIMDFLMSPLYAFVLNETKNGSKVVCEMARSFPVDVTAEYAGDARYNVPVKATEGYAWKIDLVENASWQDGTPINADSWIYSLQQTLNPKMKNYRASTLFEGSMIVAGAEKYYAGECDWENVGVVKNDDYSLTFVIDNPITEFYLFYNLGSFMLVKEDLYEAGKKQTGDIVKSSYGTSKDNMSSYGPYKIESWQAEKEFVLSRNENWFGYSDDAFKDDYMATGINFQFISSHSTILTLFLQGRLDDTALTTDDLAKYGNSDYISYSPASYTLKFSFNTDFKTLRDENSPGINHTMLSYIDFRHAISLALDRQTFTRTCFSGSVPGYGLINRCFIANPVTEELYRDIPQARQALCDFYGTEDEDDITGFDRETAKKLFQKAYDKALADGNISEGDKVVLDFHTYNAEPHQMRRVSFLQEAINQATVGTSLENRITINQVTDENYYDNLRKGNCDIALTLWGGSSYDPYSVLWCYNTEEAKHEFGFKPEIEKLTININGRHETRTYYEWYKELCAGKYAAAPYEVRNTILAANERGLLEQYTMIPFAYQRTAGLNSHRVIEGAEEFVNQLVGRGGLRALKFTMDDAEWADYCRKNGNRLAY